MDRDATPNIPEHIQSKIRDDPSEFLARDRYLQKKYQYEPEADSEPIKAIQKEIDGMARLLRRLSSDQNIQTPISDLVNIYVDEVENIRRLEEEMLEELPERE